MPPKPLPPEKIKAPTGIGINECDGKAKRKRRILRHFVARGGKLVEVEKVQRETR